MNIYDVALRAGVSTATVSRVLNGSENVSKKTKAKVQMVMKELNYMPSQLAVGLATNTTKIIGILLPDVRDSFHAEVAYRIESKMTKEGYMSILYNTSMAGDRAYDYIDSLYQKNVDGIILVGSTYHNNKIGDKMKKWEKKIPVVLINAASEGRTASIICEVKAGIKEALNHLKSRGRSHPIFLKDLKEEETFASTEKAQAFIESSQEIFHEDMEEKVYFCEAKVSSYIKFIKKLQTTKADSVLFTNDLSCAIFLKAMQEIGLNAPKDYALIGFNNANITDLTHPTITTIDHLVKKHCETAIETLLKMMKMESVDKITFIKPVLIIKETT